MRCAVAGWLAASFLTVAATPAEAVTIVLTPSAFSEVVGSSFEVQIVASDLAAGMAPSLSTFDLDISFDSSILAFQNATFGDPILGDLLDLSGSGSVTAVTPGAGTVNLFALSFDSPEDLNTLQAGSFTLATLELRAIGVGLGQLDVSVLELGDALGDPLAATVLAASVDVDAASIPEPASLWLALAGAAALHSRRRWHRRHDIWTRSSSNGKAAPPSAITI